MKTYLTVALSLAFLTLGPAAHAAWPERPVRLVVPYAAGGGTDTAARMIGKKLTERLGQPVVVENKPGGATQIGTQFVVRADPDGYTLLMGTANLATNAVLYRTLPYDVSRDLVPVIWATTVPVYLFAPGDSPAGDVAALLAQASKNPNAASYATAGQGSIPHLAGEMMARATGTALMHVPFKGSAEAATAVAGGQVAMSLDNLAPMLSQVHAGRVRALAIAAPERNPRLPEVPTLTELGYPVNAASWWGVMAPADTPADVVGRLNTELDAVLADPEVRDYFEAQGMRAMGGSPEAFAAQIQQQTEQWREVVRDAGLPLGQ